MLSSQEIQTSLKDLFPFLTANDFELLLGICTYKVAGKKEILIQSGQTTEDTFFILKGMVRGYFINKYGEEKNIFLRPEKTLTGAPECIFKGLPTRYTFETVEESHLLIFQFKDLVNLATENAQIFKIYQAGLYENILTLINRVEGMVDSTPEERYEKLIDQNPHFFQSALSKHIANYLGITPNSLSRIIRRKAKS